jgi:UDP-glucuronate 4-epimerase
MTRVLITGAAGFIGAHLTKALSTDDIHEIVGVDSFSDYYSTTYKKMRVDSLISNQMAQIINLDVSNSGLVDNLFQDFKPQVVIHLAAQAGVRLQTDNFSHYVESNLSGFSNILISSVRYGVESFLYASSSSVYGNAPGTLLSEDMHPLVPTSFYGATKLSNEILAKSISGRFGLKTRGLRFFTVYGPWGRPDMAYFRILESLVTGRTFQLNGDGSIERDFTFISDVVGMSVGLLEDLRSRPEGHSDVVNLGGGVPRSMKALIHTMENLYGKSLNMEVVSREPSDVNRTESDKDYLETLIGHRSFVSLEDGARSFLQWGSDLQIRPHLADWVESSYKYNT